MDSALGPVVNEYAVPRLFAPASAEDPGCRLYECAVPPLSETAIAVPPLLRSSAVARLPGPALAPQPLAPTIRST